MLEDKQRVLKQSHLQVEIAPNAVTKIIEWFEQFSDGLVPKQFASQCQLVLAETFTAVLRVARQNLCPTTSTSLELKLFADYLEIRILEPGLPFHLPAHLLGHLAQPEGGRGMHFVPPLIDELCYICLPERRNYLVMRKRLVKDSKSCIERSHLPLFSNASRDFTQVESENSRSELAICISQAK